MAKDYNSIFEQLKKEFAENDKKVEQEINTKDRIEISKEFESFVKNNNCKVKIEKATHVRGGKNDKK